MTDTRKDFQSILPLDSQRDQSGEICHHSERLKNFDFVWAECKQNTSPIMDEVTIDDPVVSDDEAPVETEDAEYPLGRVDQFFAENCHVQNKHKTLVIIVITFCVLLVLIMAIVLPVSGRGFETRVHYIVAERLGDWDYLPGSHATHPLQDRPFTAEELKYIQANEGLIGTKYDKAVFVEYTDETFREKKIRGAEDEYLGGVLGPIIRAEVGDTVEIHLYNKIEANISLHVSGLHYSKANEGLLYNDGEQEKAGASIGYRESYVYEWSVPATAEPASADQSSMVYSYYCGLIGPIVVAKNGALSSEGIPEGVEQEVFLLAGLYDENKSIFLDDKTAALGQDSPQELIKDASFIESNRMRGLNWFSFGSMPVIETSKNTKVRWYIMGMGDSGRAVTLRFSGNLVKEGLQHDSYVSVLPGECKTVDMFAVNTGTWLISGHGSEGARGSLGLYRVLDLEGSNSNPMYEVLNESK